MDVEQSSDTHAAHDTPSDLPRRALVVGLARSGGAALALAARGVEVVAADRDEELDTGRLRAAGVEVRLGADDPALLDGVDLLVKSPGVPAEAPPRGRRSGVPCRSGARSSWPTGSSPATRCSASRARTGRRPRPSPGRDLPRRREARRGGRERRPPAQHGRRPDPDAWIVAEPELPARGHRRASRDVGVLLNVTPDHLDRHGRWRPTPPPSSGSSRTRPRGHGSRPARVPARAGRRAPDRVRPRGRAARRAATPGNAQPREPAAAAAAARAAGIPDDAIAEALRTFAGVRTGSSRSERSAASAT